MKSIKPGRGPSGMGFVGSIIAAVFGILWIIIASSMARPVQQFSSFGLDSGPMDTAFSIFPLFGLLFIAAAIANAVYNYKNYKNKDRYSIVDIVDSTEESDPLNLKASDDGQSAAKRNPAGNFCTECGHKLDGDFAFCPGCGKDLHKNQ